MKKVPRNKDAVVDVRADDPEHAMEHFNEGLKRVLAAPKIAPRPKRHHQKRKHF